MQVRSLKEQYEIKDQILKERLTVTLQPIMAECGIDVWLIPSKEYNEDPLFSVMTPSGYPTARRISILLLHNDGQLVNCYSVSFPDAELNKFYQQAWDRLTQTQFEALNELLAKCNPSKIGLNYSANYAYCDGLSVGLYETLKKEVLPVFCEKFVSAELLGVRFLETRCELEKKYYPEVMGVAMDIINEAFSRKVITPEVTTCQDVGWFMKESVNKLGLSYWFDPTIDVQRPSGMFSGDTKIMAGDLIHCDFGLVYLGLCTDTQRLGYILQDNETEVLPALKAGMDENNRFQDIVCDNMKVGLSGNDVFTKSLEQANAEGIKAMLYTHPLGIHGHAAGPTIGLYSDQKPQPIKGELLVNDNTAYALELNTKRAIDGYENEVFFFTEESVLFANGKVLYLAFDRDKIIVI